MSGLEGLSEEQAGQWLRVAWFFMLLVLNWREELELPELILQQARHSKFHEREEMTTMGQTILEQLEARGEARGRAEGEARGEARGQKQAMRTALTTVLTARFGRLPSAIEAALAAANTETLQAWLERAATAGTLEEVGVGE
jgi:hypothetical protein